MTPAQKLAMRASDIRSRLAALGGNENLSDEENTEISELRNEYTDVETRSAALIIAGDAPTEPVVVEQRSEDRELDGLIAGASIAQIFGAALERRSTDGPTSELQEHFGLSPNQIPLVMLEQRATGVTAGPERMLARIRARLSQPCSRKAAPLISASTSPTVGVGEAVYPVLSTSADAGTPAEGIAQDETAGGFTADVLSPSRIQASFFYSREDRARFAGMDSALRMNLSEALSDKLDQQILNGTNGLLHSTNIPNNNVSTDTTLRVVSRAIRVMAGSMANMRLARKTCGWLWAAADVSPMRPVNIVEITDNTDALICDESGGRFVSRFRSHVPAVSGDQAEHRYPPWHEKRLCCSDLAGNSVGPR